MNNNLTMTDIHLRISKYPISNLPFETSIAEVANTALSIVCNFYSLEPAEILGKGRQRQIVIARGMAYALIRCSKKFFRDKTIGTFFNRDRTSVWHLLEEWKNQFDVNSIHRMEFNSMMLLFSKQLSYHTISFPILPEFGAKKKIKSSPTNKNTYDLPRTEHNPIHRNNNSFELSGSLRSNYR